MRNGQIYYQWVLIEMKLWQHQTENKWHDFECIKTFVTIGKIINLYNIFMMRKVANIIDKLHANSACILWEFHELLHPSLVVQSCDREAEEYPYRITVRHCRTFSRSGGCKCEAVNITWNKNRNTFCRMYCSQILRMHLVKIRSWYNTLFFDLVLLTFELIHMALYIYCVTPLPLLRKKPTWFVYLINIQFTCL